LVARLPAYFMGRLEQPTAATVTAGLTE